MSKDLIIQAQTKQIETLQAALYAEKLAHTETTEFKFLTERQICDASVLL